ncbi:hypothetical protein [Amycolatopsis jiangsuensis]|uniref:Uncharacterized protein n=1 Tax=Amycolatopsis jiangsuensis TaxID=1181879 RepID=A0A840J1G2_9PSEU|nr:hypothetical protein [Amycolatopsis jiangsuensis]MBB4687763.1 hypothetical protein [Amycolatopsis jiangsuensis]
MGGFHWDPRAFTLAQARYGELADQGEGYLYPMVAEHVVGWRAGGLLDLLVIHHKSLAKEVAVSAGCTPAMLRKINDNLSAAGRQYTGSDNAAAEDISATWDRMGYDLPSTGDPDLERFGGVAYDFGSGFPPSEYPGSGDFGIQDLVNTILGFPKSVVMPELSLKNPTLQSIWDVVFGTWLELCGHVTEALTGDWEGVYRAGDAMSNAGAYWQSLSTLSRRAAGTLFRHWDGEGSEFAERFVAKICAVYEDAGEAVAQCGVDYKMHAHGCYLLFSEINGMLTGIPNDMIALFDLLDRADADSVPTPSPELLAALAGIQRLATLLLERIKEVMEKLLEVAQAIEAIVGVVLAACTLFTNYSNEMRGALT